MLPAMPTDPFALAKRFSHDGFLRVTDVTDGLDAVGRANLTLGREVDERASGLASGRV